MALLAGLGSGASGLVAARRVEANRLLNNPSGKNSTVLSGALGSLRMAKWVVFVLDMNMP